MEKSIKSVSNLNNGTALGVDSLNVELLVWYYLLERLITIMQIWKIELMLKYTVMKFLFKSKGQSDGRNNVRGI